MKRGDKLVIVREVDADPSTSRTTQLITALTVLGISLDADCPYQETREMVESCEQRVVTWVLKPVSDCMRFDTQEMILAWNDPEFVRCNPEHPFSYIKQTFENHAQIVAGIGAQAPLALIRTGKRIALIPMDATPERREELLTALEK